MLNKIIIAACAVIIIAISGSAASAQRTINKRKQTGSKTQSVRIDLTVKGYEPSSFSLKKGIPARITFIRRTADECGEEVVIPAYNVRRKLPLNRPVTISLTPRKAGTFDFACGMDMLHGKLIVQ